MAGGWRKSKAGRRREAAGVDAQQLGGKTKFELLGLEATDKKVTASHSCGRIYLPLSWLGKRVKIIRLD